MKSFQHSCYSHCDASHPTSIFWNGLTKTEVREDMIRKLIIDSINWNRRMEGLRKMGWHHIFLDVGSNQRWQSRTAFFQSKGKHKWDAVPLGLSPSEGITFSVVYVMMRNPKLRSEWASVTHLWALRGSVSTWEMSRDSFTVSISRAEAHKERECQWL